MSIIIVTGACGFIGSNLVRSLNRLGLEELLLVDDKTKIDSRQNLEGCKFIKCLDKKVFIELIKRRTLNMPVSTIFHQGACTDTTEQNVNYMMHDNYVYSKEILDWALMSNINLIYASSASIYGLSSSFEEVAENEKPNNLYSFSKSVFDDLVRARLQGCKSQIVGLRYFNVYGPHEGFKGKMASLVLKHFHDYREKGYVSLFEGSHGLLPGEQARDFIYVDDVIAVNLFFLRNSGSSGIYNVGTGQSASFNELTESTLNAIFVHLKKPKMLLGDMIASNLIRYIPFPQHLLPQYQPFTKADINRLRKSGYTESFMPVSLGAETYIHYLIKQYHLNT